VARRGIPHIAATSASIPTTMVRRRRVRRLPLPVRMVSIQTGIWTPTPLITSQASWKRLTMRNKYHGGDQIHAADGTGMEIANVGHSILCSPSRSLHLNNILHVPQVYKSLCSVNRLAKDNNVYLEFHPINS
jgi:hypothetical protein